MTDAMSALEELSRAGIQANLRDGKLVTRAANGAVTPQLASLITANKGAIIELLRARQASAMLRLAPIQPAPAVARGQLSHAQQRFWLIDRMGGGSVNYHMPVALMIEGVLNREALTQAVRALVLRHEILRTVIRDQDGVPRAEVLADESGRIAEVDLADYADESDLRELRERISRDNERPFDLAVEPGMRLTLFRLSDSRCALLMNTHHIVSDGWSAGILVRELIRLYQGFASGIPCDLPAPAIQYGDYAVWQRAWPKDLIDQQLEYWKRRLAGVPALHSLPTDYPRPGTTQNRGSLCSRQIGGNAGARLSALCQQHEGTQFMGLQLVFALLLARWSATHDIVMGTPLAGRLRPELEDLIGLFVNTLVLRTRIRGTQTFRELLRQTVSDTVEAYENQLAPFDMVVDAIRPERSAGHSPLVQILIVLQNDDRVAVRFPGLELSSIDLRSSTAKVDLTLVVGERDGVLYTEWEFDTMLFARSTVERMAEQYERLLESCLERPDAPVEQLDMLAPQERERLLHIVNDNTRPYAQTGIAAVFDAVAKSHAGEVALLDGTLTVSYAELAQRAAVLARRLRERGVVAEEPVGIYLRRGTDMVVAMLAILKAGGAYVPLDPLQPADRLELIMADSRIRWVIATRELAATLSNGSAATLCVDEPSSEAAEEWPAPTGGADSLACILYPPGSTDVPKGALIEQRAILRLVLDTHYITIGPGDVVAQAAHSCFYASGFEIWGALLNGARLAFVDADTVISARALDAALNTLGVTVLWMTTALFNQAARARPEMFKGLKYLLFGGDVTDPQAIEKVLAAGKPQHLLNTYGLLGNSGFTTSSEVSVSESTGYCIGAPVANTSCYVLGSGRELLPYGAIGELYVGGDGVARGYQHRSKLNEARFSANPFAPGRLYATGDRVRWLPEGNLQFLGRSDRQLKVRGFRVEPSDIETHLLRLEGVRAAAVVLSASGERISVVAYVTLEPGERAPARPRTLKRQLAALLPPHMIPDALVVLGELPLSVDGMIDRQRLPAPQPSDFGSDDSSEPDGEMEVALIGMWREVLQREVTSATVSFFELGGNSLSLIGLSSRIQETFGARIEIREFFDSASVREQARLISARVGLSEGQIAIPKQPVAADYPLSYPQQRLWFESLRGNSASYNVPVGLELDGALDAGALAKALQDVVAAHDVLRTRYFEREGLGRQSITPAQDWSLQRVDLRGESDPEGTARKMLVSASEEPIDLRLGPVFSAVLYQLGENRHCLLLRMHHIVTDGWSSKLLQERITSLYSAYAGGKPPAVPYRPFIQYTDYAVWQQQLKADAVGEEAVARSLERLEFVRDMPLLPVDNERYLASSYPVGVRRFRVEPLVAERLRRTALEGRTSLFGVALALFGILIGRYSKQRKLVIGTDFGGRDLKQTEELLGLFINELPIVVEPRGSGTFAEYLAEVRDSVLFAMQHQRVPVEQLIGRLGLQRGRTQHPLFQVKLVLQNFAEVSPLTFPGVSVRSVTLDGAGSKIDLMLTLVERGDGIDGSWEFNAAYLKDSTVAHLQREWLDLVELHAHSAALTLDELYARLDAMARERLVELRQSSRTRLTPGGARQRAPLTSESELCGGQTRLRVVSPAGASPDLAGWIQGHKDKLEQWLVQDGGVLFRGFDVDLDTAFNQVAAALISERQPYIEGATPRTLIRDGVYTSTEFPQDQRIAPHNELSYVLNWPMRIAFACRQPAQTGGETPLTDVRAVLANIDPQIVAQFERLGWMLVRNYGTGLGPDWRKAFNTDSLDGVRDYCARGRIDLEILGPDRLRTRQRRPAVHQHPRSGERVWFNHVAFWHPASLQPAVRAGLALQFAPLDLPYYTCWGDGSEVSDAVIEHLNAAYEKASLVAPWRRNDVIVLDNMLIAHGRMPFTGPRSIIVAMGDPHKELQ